MAISVVNKAAASPASSTSVNQSITRVAGRVYPVNVSSLTNTSTNPSTPTVSGTGITQIASETNLYTSSGTNRRRVTTIWALASSSGTNNFVIAHGTAPTRQSHVIDEIDGGDTTTPYNASNVQITASSSATNVLEEETVMSALGHADHRVYSVFSGNVNSATVRSENDADKGGTTNSTDWTDLGSVGNSSTPTHRTLTFWNDESVRRDLTPGFIDPNNGFTYGQIGFELNVVQDTNISVGVIAAVASLPDPAGFTGSADIVSAVIAAIADVPSPTVSLTVPTSSIDAIASVPAPADLTGTASIAPAAISAVAAVPGLSGLTRITPYFMDFDFEGTTGDFVTADNAGYSGVTPQWDIQMFGGSAFSGVTISNAWSMSGAKSGRWETNDDRYIGVSNPGTPSPETYVSAYLHAEGIRTGDGEDQWIMRVFGYDEFSNVVAGMYIVIHGDGKIEAVDENNVPIGGGTSGGYQLTNGHDYRIDAWTEPVFAPIFPYARVHVRIYTDPDLHRQGTNEVAAWDGDAGIMTDQIGWDIGNLYPVTFGLAHVFSWDRVLGRTDQLPEPYVKTVVPAAISAVAAVPSPVVGFDVTFASSSIDAVASLPAPTVVAGADVASGVIAAIAAVPDPDGFTGSANLTPSVIAAIAAMPSPVVVQGEDVSAIAAVASVPAPTIVQGEDVQVIAAVASVPSPTIVATADVTTTSIIAIASVPSPTVVSSVDIAPAVINAVADVPSATPLDAVIVSPSVIAAIAAVPSPTMAADADVAVAAISAVASVPDVGIGMLIDSSAIVAIAAVPSPGIEGLATVVTTSIAAVASVPTPDVAQGLLLASIDAVVSVPSPNIDIVVAIAPSAIAAIAAVPSPTFDITVDLQPSAITAVASVPSPTAITGTAALTPAVIAAVADVPSVVASLIASVPTISAVASVPSPLGLNVFSDYLFDFDFDRGGSDGNALTFSNIGYTPINSPVNEFSIEGSGTSTLSDDHPVSGQLGARFAMDDGQSYIEARIIEAPISQSHVSGYLYIAAFPAFPTNMSVAQLIGKDDLGDTVLGYDVVVTYDGQLAVVDDNGDFLGGTTFPIEIGLYRYNAFVDGTSVAITFYAGDYVHTTNPTGGIAIIDTLPFAEFDQTTFRFGGVLDASGAGGVHYWDRIQGAQSSMPDPWLGTPIAITISAIVAIPSPRPAIPAAAITAIAAVPSATMLADNAFGVSDIVAIASVPSPDFSLLITAPTIAAVAAVPTPNIEIGIVSSTIVAVADVPPSGPSFDEFIVGPTISAIAAVPDASVSVDSPVGNTVISAVADVPSPGVDLDQPVGTINVIASVPDVGISTSISIASVFAVADIPSPTLFASGDISPAAIIAVVDVPSPSLSGLADIAVAAITAVASVPAPNVIATADVVTAAINAVAQVFGDIIVDAPIGIGVIPVVANVPDATMSIDTPFVTAHIAAFADVPSPNVLFDTLVGIMTIEAVASVPDALMNVGIGSLSIDIIVTMPTPGILVQNGLAVRLRAWSEGQADFVSPVPRTWDGTEWVIDDTVKIWEPLRGAWVRIIDLV